MGEDRVDTGRLRGDRVREPGAAARRAKGTKIVGNQNDWII